MFLDYSPIELKSVFHELGLPAYRLSQVRRWLFARKTEHIDRMTDISKFDRQTLANRFSPGQPVESASLLTGRIVARLGDDAGTVKLLHQFSDGQRVESVLLRDDRNHRTGCISTQVGCAMGCVFCASGLDGCVRNLTRGEILEQIVRLNSLVSPKERLTHLVIMGTGEPLLNLPALLGALEDATAADGLDISNRRITISTVGISEGIRKLAGANLPYKLAISLHAPTDELRNKLIPQNRHNNIASIVAAADLYFQQTGRRVTYEYILIDGCNSDPEQARQLVSLLKNKTAIVNIIPYNRVKELAWRPPASHTVRTFVELLEQGGLSVKIRFRKGDGIGAACGQLRRSRVPE